MEVVTLGMRPTDVRMPVAAIMNGSRYSITCRAPTWRCRGQDSWHSGFKVQRVRIQRVQGAASRARARLGALDEPRRAPDSWVSRVLGPPTGAQTYLASHSARAGLGFRGENPRLP